MTSKPSACSVGMSLLKHEPSAHRPWTKTILGLVAIDSSPNFERKRAHPELTVNSGCPGCPFLSIVMIIHDEQQSTSRSCGRQSGGNVRNLRGLRKGH